MNMSNISSSFSGILKGESLTNCQMMGSSTKAVVLLNQLVTSEYFCCE